MKTIISFLSLLLVCVHSLQAQTNYYKETQVLKGEGYEYQCNVQYGGLVMLGNRENRYSYEDVVYKTTGKIFDDGSLLSDKNNIPVIEPNPEMLDEANNIINKAFTQKEALGFGDKKLTITMYIDSNTGKISEVYFSFLYLNPYAYIPVSTYRNIEVQLKQNIHFTPSELGRQLKVIMISWAHKPTGYLGTPEPITPPSNP